MAERTRIVLPGQYLGVMRSDQAALSGGSANLYPNTMVAVLDTGVGLLPLPEIFNETLLFLAGAPTYGELKRLTGDSEHHLGVVRALNKADLLLTMELPLTTRFMESVTVGWYTAGIGGRATTQPPHSRLVRTSRGEVLMQETSLVVFATALANKSMALAEACQDTAYLHSIPYSQIEQAINVDLENALTGRVITLRIPE